MRSSAKLLCLFLSLSLLSGCACGQLPQPSSPTAAPPSAPARIRLPENLSYGENGMPLVNVYVTSSSSVEEMDIEQYLAGVLAGEMEGDWPMEALKAQALLARSFALRFMLEKGGSKYEGADLSTDVEEAQAYRAEGINDRILEAIEQTRGLVIADESGMPIHAWFHSHSGGVTATAKEGLDFEEDEPPYIQSIEIEESTDAPEETQFWQAEFTLEDIQSALDSLGGGDASSLSIEEIGPSGRAVRFSAGGNSVSAPAFRLALGGTKMRSTLLTDLSVTNGMVFMSGKGYGHGVGMSQWGAHTMAREGKSAKKIVQTFFRGVHILSAWGEDAAEPET